MLALQASFRHGFRGPGCVLALQASFRRGFRGLGYGCSLLLLCVCYEVFHSSLPYAFLFRLLGCVEGVFCSFVKHQLRSNSLRSNERKIFSTFITDNKQTQQVMVGCCLPIL